MGSTPYHHMLRQCGRPIFKRSILYMILGVESALSIYIRLQFVLIVSHQKTESVSIDHVCQSYTEHLLHL